LVTAIGLDQNEVHQLYAAQKYTYYVVGGQLPLHHKHAINVRNDAIKQ